MKRIRDFLSARQQQRGARPSITGLYIPVLLLLIIFLVWVSRESLDQLNILTVVQVLASIILLLVTMVYVQETARIADKTSEMADQTARSVAQVQFQRYAAVRPVVVLGLLPGRSGSEPTLIEFKLHITNLGNGPALDLKVDPFETAEYEHQWVAELRPLAQPIALAAGESIKIDFQIAHNAASNRFLDEIWADRAAGMLLTTYRDSYNRVHATRAHLQAGERVGNGRDRELRIVSQDLELPPGPSA